MRHRAPGRLPYPPLYLFLPSCTLILCPTISSPPSLRLSTFPALSSPAFRAFILLHLPFPFRDPFSPFNIALLALLPPDPLPSCSSSSLGFACLFYTRVSSTRSSYIPGMPVTYGPHSGRSAVRPSTLRCPALQAPAPMLRAIQECFAINKNRNCACSLANQTPELRASTCVRQPSFSSVGLHLLGLQMCRWANKMDPVQQVLNNTSTGCLSSWIWLEQPT